MSKGPPTGPPASMAVSLKTQREIELMRQAGRLVHRVLQRIADLVAPGVTTGELNQEAERLIREAGAQPLFKGVTHRGVKFPFPAALCVSVNEEVVHGIPGPRRLREGDIVSIDCGVRLNGYCGDAAVTLPVGHVEPEARRLLDVTAGALDLAIREVRPGRRWSEIARKMQAFVENAGFSVVREFVGHGIGTHMHEEPKVVNFYDPLHRNGDFVLRPGLTIAVEPMVNAGEPAVQYADDTGWTVITRDRRLSAHFEHVLAVTETGCDVLTDGR